MTNQGDWVEVNLGDVVQDIQPGFARRPRPSNSGGKIAQLRTNNIGPDGMLDLREMKRVAASRGEIRKYALKEGDVLFNNTNSDIWVGKTAFVGQDLEALYSNHLTRIRADPSKIEPRYLALQLQQFQRDGFFRWISTHWVNQTAVNATALRTVRLRIPPIEQQRRIVSIAGHLNSLRRTRQEAIRLGQEMAQSIFLKMFGDPAANPLRWKRVPFQELAVIDRKAVRPEDIGEETKYVGLEHIEKSSGEITGLAEIKPGEIKSTKHAFTSNHVLYGKLRPYLNKVALPDFAGVCSTDILPISPKKGKATREYIAHLIRHPYFVAYATAKSIGANLPRISPPDIERFEVPAPPYEVQERFSALVLSSRKLSAAQNETVPQLNELFDSFMHKAFRGELKTAS